MCVSADTHSAQCLDESVHRNATEPARQCICFADLYYSLSAAPVSGAVVVAIAAVAAAAAVRMPLLTLQVVEQRKRGVLTRQQIDAVAQAVTGVCE